MEQWVIEAIKVGGPFILGIIVALAGISIKNKNSVKNKNSNNITKNSGNVKLSDVNYGIENDIDNEMEK